MTEAPNYNDGLWHGWNGGECPVDPGTMINAIFDDKSGFVGDKTERADFFRWDGSLAPVAFRVVHPAPPQPRTIYLCEDPGLIPTIHKTAIDATKAALSYGPGATVSEWREVL